MEKLKVDRAIVVEGKYDKIKLSAVVDAVIICTNGFGIYNDKNTLELIKRYAEKNGIIILTDSDSAGFQIRNHLKGTIPQGKIINLYIPEVFGKEKRKSAPSKEGKLGVEGIDIDILRRVFEQSGVLCSDNDKADKATSMDMYDLGLNGKPDSSRLRRELCKKLDLPLNLNAKALTDYISFMLTRTQLCNLMAEITNDNT